MSEGCAWAVGSGGLTISVRLTPKSSRDALEAPEALSDGRMVLKARVRAVPEDGKANEALIKLVAKALGAPARSVSVESGATSRLKSLRVAGDGPALASALEDFVRKAAASKG